MNRPRFGIERKFIECIKKRLQGDAPAELQPSETENSLPDDAESEYYFPRVLLLLFGDEDLAPIF